MKLTWDAEERGTNRTVFTIFLGLEVGENKYQSNKCIGSIVTSTALKEQIEYGLTEFTKALVRFDEERAPLKISG